MTDYTLVTKDKNFNELLPITQLDVLSDAITHLTKMYNRRLNNLHKSLTNDKSERQDNI
jgi:hypothetical protein